MPNKKKITVVLPVGVARYPHLVKPDAFKGKGAKGDDQTPKFKLSIVWAKDVDLSVVDEKIKEAVAAEWGPKAKPAAVRSFLKDGDDYNQKRDDNGKEIDEFLAGKVFVQASSKYRPQIVDAKNKTIKPGLIRGGDEVRAIIELVPCEPSGVRTIGTRLLAVRLVKKNNNAEGWASEFGAEDDDAFEADEDDVSNGDEPDEAEDEKSAKKRAKRPADDDEDDEDF